MGGVSRVHVYFTVRLSQPKIAILSWSELRIVLDIGHIPSFRWISELFRYFIYDFSKSSKSFK